MSHTHYRFIFVTFSVLISIISTIFLIPQQASYTQFTITVVNGTSTIANGDSQQSKDIEILLYGSISSLHS